MSDINSEDLDTPTVNQQKMEKVDQLCHDADNKVKQGHPDEAIHLATQAIQADSSTTKGYTKRAEIYIGMKKYHKAIEDCEHAFKLNPDCPRAYKFRGRARHLLGELEEAYYDYGQNLGLDPCDEVHNWMKEIKDKVLEIQKAKHKH
ncbi:Hsc70-interacting protein 2 [Thelohanellus kitauei]|uniref:Hsc70-interacting protein 2 n=1 Tax=Thelohanellus kitauei TaxID=669202 RepID=A0A0C2IAJ0_THEKT|nr:Hsc70-interacting protein 2 [Thelohanellus kitauei]